MTALSAIFIAFTLLFLTLIRATSRGIHRWWASAFTLFWGAILSASAENPYGLEPINLRIYLIFAIFVVCYLLGFMFAAKPSSSPITAPVDEFRSFTHGNVLNFTLVAVCIALAYYFVRYIEYVGIFGSIEARISKFEIGKIFSSGAEFLLFNFVIGGLLWLAKFIVAFGLAFRQFSLCWVLSTIASLLYMGFGAGRIILAEIAVMTILLFSVGRQAKGQKASRMNSRWLFFILLPVMYAIILYATAFRRFDFASIDLAALSEANDILIDNIVVYCVGPIRAFQHALFNDESRIGFNYGLLTFGSIDELITYPLRALGIDREPRTWDVGLLLAQEIDIGGGHSFNALYTAVFSYYFDIGLAGVVLFSSAFGVCSSLAVSAYCAQQRLSTCAFLSVLFVVTAYTFLSWKLQSAPVLVAMACMWFWIPRAGNASDKRLKRRTAL